MLAALARSIDGSARHRAVDHRRLDDPVLGGQLAGHHADRAHPRAIAARPRCAGPRPSACARCAPCRGRARVLVGRRLAADRLAVGQHEVRAHLREVLDEQDVGAAARRDRADVVAAADVLGRVDRRHLDRHQRVDPGAIAVRTAWSRWPTVGERLGVHVVGDEQRVARVDAVLEQHRARASPRRATPSPRAAAPTSRRAAWPARRCAAPSRGRSRRRRPRRRAGGGRPSRQAPVPGHRQPRVEHGADHLVGGLVGLDDAGHVHHLAEAADALPAQRLADVLGPDRSRRRPRSRAAPARMTAPRADLEREPAALLEHPADALEAEHVGHLVVVDEHGRGAVREDRLGEARRP